ncbi:TrlF family AAA-like ATPase [Lysobacter gummosus]|uniref:Chromosome segregation protein SMC n=1 Tax=Lysobacter gummosus TaxID=262324 RepID=A0ABY3X7Y6_9GAMM|nr:chromosome segregation protein SMC [Lysobacter gummosus]ALN92501.1 AAA domain protein [Lysobacter gummosus]UNP28075.1 chromosome segregation protein SMC [Lysobacter gummosus]
MSNPWPYPGSRWWKFDFHTHTPASLDTRAWQLAVDTPDEVTPEKWLLRYMAAEVDCVAITDHNSGAWIDQLKNAYSSMKTHNEAGSGPTGFRPLHIFPGVELSVQGGFHLLAIFSPKASTSDIDSLLGSVGYGGTKGDSDAVTSKGAAEVIQLVLDADGIVIPAHADEISGLLAVIEGTKKSALAAGTLKQILEIDDILAMEWRDDGSPLPSEYDRSKRSWARVIGSDCHNFKGTIVPGYRFTWIKMATPTLEGLRLALLDGNDTSVRRSYEPGPFHPFDTPQNFITRIEIINARYMGNKKGGEEILLTPFYNAIIGGRGTGKSTVIHAVRIAYNRDSELDKLPLESEPRKQFTQFKKEPKDRNGDGALRSDTEINIEMLREGIPHRLSWSATTKKTTVFARSVSGVWEATSSQALGADRFPIRLYSQGQIAAMAGGSRRALLEVIDEAASIGGLKRSLEDAQNEYYAKRSTIRALNTKLADQPEAERRLEDIDRKLEAFTELHHADALKKHQIAARQQQQLESTREHLRSLADDIQQFAEGVQALDWEDDLFHAEIDKDALAWRDDATLVIESAKSSLSKVSEQVLASSESLEHSPLLSSWIGRLQIAASGYAAFKEALAANGVTDPDHFGNLVEERESVVEELKQHKDNQEKHNTLTEESEKIFLSVSSSRKAITKARQSFLQEHLTGNNFVDITVVPYGDDPRTIEIDIRSLLGLEDQLFQQDILQFEDGKSPAGLAYEIASSVDKEAALQRAKERLKVIDGFGGHFRNHLQKKTETQKDWLDRLRCWFPEDDLRISYSRSGDGKSFTSIEQGSPGQRAAALMAFLLAFGDEPLILDQPEDDLDNHLIYELVVQQIKKNKLRRQLIIVTHNANIVVNGDAEIVNALEFNGQCYVKRKGALQEQEVRTEVCHIMEGGPDAFKKRWARLGRSL